MKRGVIAEMPRAETLFLAIHALRDRGIEKIETYTPYPIEGIDRALGAPRSPIAYITAAGAFGGVLGAYGLQWLLEAYLYPVTTGMRPPHMPLAYVIITIEMGFLFGGLAAFFGCLAIARLVKLWEPVLEVKHFESASRAGFWIAIDADDPRFAERLVESELVRVGALRVSTFGGLP